MSSCHGEWDLIFRREGFGAMAKSISGKKDSKQVFWKAHIGAANRSGLSLAEYCRRHGLSCSAFRYWRRKLGKGAGTPVSLVPVPGVIPQEESHHACNAADLRLNLKGRFTVEVGDGFSPATLARLVSTLEAL